MDRLNFLGSAAIVGWALLAANNGGFARGAEPMSDYEQHTFTAHGGTLPYRLLKPIGDSKSGKYPLVLALHGWGQRGTDNQKQLKFIGPKFLQKRMREKFPCFVLLPQTNGSWVQHAVFDKPIALTKAPAASLAMAFDLVTMVTKKYPIDTDRIYLMGISNGAAARGTCWSGTPACGRPRSFWREPAIPRRWRPSAMCRSGPSTDPTTKSSQLRT